MKAKHNTLEALATEARRGSSRTRASFRNHMEHEFIHIVRRSLRDGQGKSPLDRKIRAEARRIAMESATNPLQNQERLIRMVAQSLCASVITNLPTGPAEVRFADETICETAGY
jgi:hypothetical protein